MEEVEAVSNYILRFEFVDELGQPLKGIRYKTLPAGEKKDLHKADGKANRYGKTFFASTQQDESIDCYIVWDALSAKGKNK